MQPHQNSNQNLPNYEIPYWKEQILDPLKKSLFSLSFSNPLRDYDLVCASYSQKHQLILACSDCNLFIYDTNTLFPSKSRKTNLLDGNGIFISNYHETETFLIGCSSEAIYSYNADHDELKILQESQNRMHESMATGEILDSSYYAFGFEKSKELLIGSLTNENEVTRFDLKNKGCTALHYLEKRKLFISGLDDGFLRIFSTKKLPNSQSFCLIQAHQHEKYVSAIKSINVNGKELIVTSAQDGTVKIWHLRKGKMRLIKVIRAKENASSFVYLERFKMIVTDADESIEIKFFKLLSGKLERTLDFSKAIWRDNLFLMKDKNIVACTASGVIGSSCDAIEFIQIHPLEEK